jgi:hypothetical protein
MIYNLKYLLSGLKRVFFFNYNSKTETFISRWGKAVQRARFTHACQNIVTQCIYVFKYAHVALYDYNHFQYITHISPGRRSRLLANVLVIN